MDAVVAIRVDAGPTVGAGHLGRMVALAGEFQTRGATTVFLGNGLGAAGGASITIARPAFDGSMNEDADAEWTARQICDHDAGVVVVDHYGLGLNWERRVASLCPGLRIVAFDDLDRAHNADVLVDPNLGAGGPRPAGSATTSLLPGSAFVPLGNEYQAPPRPWAEGDGRPRLLISLGGGRSGLLGGLVRSFMSRTSSGEINLEIVVPERQQQRMIERLVRGRPGWCVHGRVPSLRPLIERADLVVGAGGTSAWQRLRLGVPSLVLVTAANQLRTGNALDGLGVAHRIDLLSGGADVDDVWAATVRALDDRMLRERAWTIGPILVDGQGAKRVVFALRDEQAPPRLRPANESDAAALLSMANDPVTRAVSRDASPIDPAAHLDWLRRSLRSTLEALLVAESEGLVVGQVRFSRLSNAWELSYGLDRIARGRGWAAGMISEALSRLSPSSDMPVVAVVARENVASSRALERAGFRGVTSEVAEVLGAAVPRGFGAYLWSAAGEPQPS